MIRFLCNENIPLASIHLLRQAGWDIAAIIDAPPGVNDTEVMRRANREQRIIVISDQEYGELLDRRRLPAPPGILYLRFAPLTPEEPGEYLLRLLSKQTMALAGHFSVTDRNQLRQRSLQQLP